MKKKHNLNEYGREYVQSVMEKKCAKKDKHYLRLLILISVGSFFGCVAAILFAYYVTK